MKVTPRDSQRLSSQRPGGLGKEQRRQTELFHIGHLTLAFYWAGTSNISLRKLGNLG
jgi:hypothetical protein